jgi:hypothetical protein
MALIKKNESASAPTEKPTSTKPIPARDCNDNVTQNSKSHKDGRYRQWTIIVYPDSAPADWRDRLNGLQWVESPLHDRDVNPDGTPKKPHWHTMIFNAGKISYNQAKEIADMINGASPEYVKNVTGMIRYFAHIDNPEKAQYDKSDIIGHGVDVSKYLDSEDDIDKLEQEIEIYCEENHISEYSQLIKLSRQFDGWHKCVSTHTIHFKAFVTSLRHAPSPSPEAEKTDLANAALEGAV